MKEYDYKGLCWWCGKVADSREHKYKKSDLVREFGPGQYKTRGGMLRITNEKDHKIQGPNSKQLKFEMNLCGRCNSAKSQKFDIAYDRFIDFIKAHENSIINSRKFKMSEIFGVNWKEEVEKVKKYYVKHICCRLAEANVYIHPKIINYLDGRNRLKYINMKMEFMEEFLAIKRILEGHGENRYGIAMGQMSCILNKHNDIIKMVYSCYQYRWLRLTYFYDRRFLKSSDNFSNNSVYLPNRQGFDAYKILFNNHK